MLQYQNTYSLVGERQWREKGRGGFWHRRYVFSVLPFICNVFFSSLQLKPLTKGKNEMRQKSICSAWNWASSVKFKDSESFEGYETGNLLMTTTY